MDQVMSRLHFVIPQSSGFPLQLVTLVIGGRQGKSLITSLLKNCSMQLTVM
jgi:hypothetical protein